MMLARLVALKELLMKHANKVRVASGTTSMNDLDNEYAWTPCQDDAEA